MAVEFVNEAATLDSTTVRIYRTATVVKGGRRFSWAAMMVVGDRHGSVGIGYGKATGVPAAIEKAQKVAKKKLVKITLKGGTLPHQVTGKFGASTVKLIPAAPGTGVIAGATVRAVLEMAGVRDCLTKAYGSTNQKNLCKATMEGLKSLRSKEEVARLRGIEIESSVVEELLEAGERYAPAVTVTSKPATAGGKTSKKSGSPGGKSQPAKKEESSEPVSEAASVPEAHAQISDGTSEQAGDTGVDGADSGPVVTDEGHDATTEKTEGS